MASDIDKIADELRRKGVASSSSEVSQNKPYKTTSSKEYVQAVSQWLDLYRGHYMAHYTMMVGPYYMAMGYAQAACQFMTNQSGATSVSGVNSQNVNPVGNMGQQANQQQMTATINGQNGAPAIVREFIIPSIYRRVFAEFIDFVLLFSIKLTITMYAILYFGVVDQTSFALKFLAEEIDEDATMEDLQQVLAIAFVYRSFVCIYETIFLASTMRRTTLGGATPGKFMMGLRTISCERVQTLGEGRVQVTLPDNLTYIQAFGRAVIKNFSMAFFFPACITMFFNPHLRSTYDIIAKTVVVSAHQDFINDVNNNRNPGR